MTRKQQKDVERAIAGDDRAFSRLYAIHVDGVFRYVLFRVRNSPDAEDVTQQVFEKAYRSIGGLRDVSRFRSWLYSIAHSEVVNWLKSRATRPEFVELPADWHSLPGGTDEGPLSAVDRHLTVERILESSPALTDLQAQVIALRFVAGLSVQDAAAVLNRSQGAVRNLQYHALISLRRSLSAAEEDGP